MAREFPNTLEHTSSTFEGVLTDIERASTKVFQHYDSAKSSDNTAKIDNIILAPQALQKFFLYRAQQQLFTSDHVTLPSKIQDFKSVDSFKITSKNCINTASKHPEYIKTHLLSEDEYEKAYNFLQDTPLLTKAFQIIQTECTNYLQALNDDIATSALPALKKDVTHQEIRILKQGGLEDHTMLERLLPATALIALEKKAKQEEVSADFSAETARALTLCFQRKAFNASSYDGLMTCPMKKIIGHMLNTTFERDNKGELRLSDTSIPGGLVGYIYQQLENTPTPNTTTPPQPIQAHT